MITCESLSPYEVGMQIPRGVHSEMSKEGAVWAIAAGTGAGVLEPRYKHQGLSEFRWKDCYDEAGVRQPIEEEPPPQPSEYRRVSS